MADPRIAYREAAVRGASPVQLVIRLYEQIVEDLRHAIKAIEQNEVELRTGKINHAILVLAHLQSQLDLQAGGEAARHLSTFYDAVRSGLVRAQFRGSKTMLAQQITDIMEVRSAWLQVERQNTRLPLDAPTTAGPMAADGDLARANWKA
jgi:flagellar secretion chaperone FliS